MIKDLDNKFSWEIDYILRKNALSFEKWRYQHEKNATCFYAFGELRFALREAIIKKIPKLGVDRIIKQP
jgi:hypothetical protein